LHDYCPAFQVLINTTYNVFLIAIFILYPFTLYINLVYLKNFFQPSIIPRKHNFFFQLNLRYRVHTLFICIAILAVAAILMWRGLTSETLFIPTETRAVEPPPATGWMSVTLTSHNYKLITVVPDCQRGGGVFQRCKVLINTMQRIVDDSDRIYIYQRVQNALPRTIYYYGHRHRQTFYMRSKYYSL